MDARRASLAVLVFSLFAGCSSGEPPAPAAAAPTSGNAGTSAQENAASQAPAGAAASAPARTEAGADAGVPAMTNVAGTATQVAGQGAGGTATGGAGSAAPAVSASGSAAPPAAGGGGQPASAGAGAAGRASGPLALTATDTMLLSDGLYAFPSTAVPPTNQSPGFSWTGVPTQAKSLALVFRDVSSNPPPVKWIVWDIPPNTARIPPNIPGDSAHPAQVPGASQLGSLGNQGYAGPCCTDHKYEWILYALDVPMLSGTERLSTADIRMNLLLMHQVAASAPLMMRIMP